MTNSSENRDSSVMMSSTMPSAKYSCSGSEFRLVKGRTAMEGLSGRASAALALPWASRWPRHPPALPAPSHETIALPRQRLDQTLFLTVIADRTSGHIQAGRQCRVRDDAPVPYGRNQIVLADNASSISDEVVEEIKHLRRNGNHVQSATQLAPIGIEYAVIK